MSSLKVLISGGGIGGPALAFWLAQLGHDVTVIERTTSLRAQGQQIDIRGQAVTVIRRMGLEPLIRSKVVDEDGLAFVDSKGKVHATFEPNKSGKGRQAFTSEFEIMRGDLVRILFDQTKDLGVKYVFGTTIESLEQNTDAVTVRLSDGTTDTYDLLVGADGQSSKTRRLLLGPGQKDPFYPLGLHMAYYTIPKWKTDTKYCTVHICPKQRVIFTRNDNPETTQAYMAIVPQNDAMNKLLQEAEKSRDLALQKRVWTELFSDAGWQAPRFLDALADSELTDDFYCVEIGQIRMDKCYKNRVVLLGDAGFAPSPLSGRGTSCAFVGAYVLAGEISKHCLGDLSKASDGIPAALEAYNKAILPMVKNVQDMKFKPSRLYPKSAWVISILYRILWLITFLKIDKLLQRLQSDDVEGWELPEYPRLPPKNGKGVEKVNGDRTEVPHQTD
ncbi:hypothetical protein CCHL11_07178 [Colletotrichum chlorophyti]|uniref:FAD-binding domain-containing protein n=1 Tax=Colletotrichum chlorophyti TaxID=708187 RepID=A0A1Q8S0L2_9PEZI|nr:hypothetical protein CCHL11_07178 [Colletotrichum chlorophyti]